MAETKHEFIDDNPYITYTGKPETAYDGEGGGGGGGGSTIEIKSYEIKTDSSGEYDEYYIDVTNEQLYQDLSNPNIRVFVHGVIETYDESVLVERKTHNGFISTVEFDEYPQGSFTEYHFSYGGLSFHSIEGKDKPYMV